MHVLSRPAERHEWRCACREAAFTLVAEYALGSAQGVAASQLYVLEAASLRAAEAAAAAACKGKSVVMPIYNNLPASIMHDSLFSHNMHLDSKQ